MISLPDCNGFAPFRATPDACRLVVEALNPPRGPSRIAQISELLMTAKTALKILFSCIFLTLLSYNLWASTRQPLLQWSGLTAGPDRYWNIAAFMDAYFGFLTFYVWVLYKETGSLPRIVWFAAIMLLGNIAMSAYVLLHLMRLAPAQQAHMILTARNR
jgi:Protein of unknown function (DUF1475)